MNILGSGFRPLSFGVRGLLVLGLGVVRVVGLRPGV